MPGQLRTDATCPCCGDPLDAIVDTTSQTITTKLIVREYFHGKNSPKARRRRRCVRKFFDEQIPYALNERQQLEV